MTELALFGGMPGTPEVILTLFVVLLLFGAKKLPGLARALGKSLNEFKRGKDEVMRELTSAQDDIMSDTPVDENYEDEIEDDEDEIIKPEKAPKKRKKTSKEK
jgi:sec-independent protein translocase protein TatA